MEFTIEELRVIAKLALDHVGLMSHRPNEKRYLKIVEKVNFEIIEINNRFREDPAKGRYIKTPTTQQESLPKLIKGDIYTCEYIDGDQFIFRFKKYKGGKPSPDVTIVKYYFLYSESSNKSVKNEWAVVKSCDRTCRYATDREIRLFEYEEQKSK